MTTLLQKLRHMLEHASASSHPVVLEMKATVEDSSWHREANTWVHTEMVVNQFISIWEASDRDHDDIEMFHGGLAALFHDFGKPEAEEEFVNKVTGAPYRRYAGHESVSATNFRNFATNPQEWLSTFGVSVELEPMDIYLIALMIQHHLPYSYKPQLTASILQTVELLGGQIDVFFSLLRADARGRISDDHEAKLADVEAWIAETSGAYEPTADCMLDDKKPVAYVIVGPSGSGKSTYLASMGIDKEAVFSQDALRMERYGDEALASDPLAYYSAAWRAAVADEQAFNAAATAAVHKVCKSAHHFVVSDNTNLTKKRRREFIAAAKQAGRMVVAVVFVTVPVAELIRRGEARGNRGVPPERLIEMFRSMYLPALDEVDMIYAI